jgi:thymidine kinase
MKKDSCLPFSYMNKDAYKRAYSNIKKENQDLKNKLEKINNTLNASFIIIDKVQTFEKNQLEIINSIMKGDK